MTMQSLSRGLCLLAMLAAAPAFAQQPAPPAPAQAPAQAPAGAIQAAPGAKPNDVNIPIPNATPAHLAACRELVIRSGLSRSFDGAIPDMMRQMHANLTRTRPELANDLKTVLEGLVQEALKLTEDMIVNGSRIYTALMNEQECKDAVAFFKSPIGAKFIDVQPVVFGNISDVMEPWRRHLAQRIFEMARDEMKKKGHSL